MVFSITPCLAQPLVWHQGISETGIDVRGNPVVVGQISITVPGNGDVLVQFDGKCVASPGDMIVLAASDNPDWGVNDGNVGFEAANADANRCSFSHTRKYSVSSGNYTFYAVAENYVEYGGTGLASIYASLTVKYFPDNQGHAFVTHQGISETTLYVRGGDVVVGQQTIQVDTSGHVLVHFDGSCYADVGDKIILAASNTPYWWVNDGNVSVEAYSSDVNHGCFSHSRMYSVSAGSHTFYAIAHNYVEEEGNGYTSIYGSLTIEFYPDIPLQAFVEHQGISRTHHYVRGGPVTLGQISINAFTNGQAIVHFDGLCVTDVGDRIVLAANDYQAWGVNDGNVCVEAINADQNGFSFSHTRVFDIDTGNHNFYAVAENYVEQEGNGYASIYASLSVEFYPEPSADITNLSDNIPSNYILDQNFPNPFNANTTIRYNLPEPSYVTINIYDLLGRNVETLVDQNQQAGYYQVTWNPDDLTSGKYFYKLQSDNHTEFKSMMLIK